MTIKAFFLFTAFASAVFAAGPVSAATIVINQPKLELEIAPGETVTGEIVVENPTEEVTAVRVYLEDFAYLPGASGEKSFVAAGTGPYSASQFLTFTPTDISLPPYGKATLRYTIRLPEDAVGGYYSVIFFETIIGQVPDREGVALDVAGRVGSLFLIESKGTQKREGSIEAVEIRPSPGNKPLEIETTFRNTGNVHIPLTGNFVLMDEQGGIGARGELAPIYSMPGAVAKGTTQWVGRVPKGSYTALLTYNLGKGKSLVEEKSLVVE